MVWEATNHPLPKYLQDPLSKEPYLRDCLPKILQLFLVKLSVFMSVDSYHKKGFRLIPGVFKEPLESGGKTINNDVVAPRMLDVNSLLRMGIITPLNLVAFVFLTCCRMLD